MSVINWKVIESAVQKFYADELARKGFSVEGWFVPEYEETEKDYPQGRYGYQSRYFNVKPTEHYLVIVNELKKQRVRVAWAKMWHEFIRWLNYGSDRTSCWQMFKRLVRKYRLG